MKFWIFALFLLVNQPTHASIRIHAIFGSLAALSLTIIGLSAYGLGYPTHVVPGCKNGPASCLGVFWPNTTACPENQWTCLDPQTNRSSNATLTMDYDIPGGAVSRYLCEAGLAIGGGSLLLTGIGWLYNCCSGNEGCCCAACLAGCVCCAADL